MGDIIGIVDKNADVVARYTYDAWGVCTVTQDSVGIAQINPFRYRGYYYDEEIGMYYLQSRYYDPFVGRFINSDDVQFVVTCSDSLRTNLYSYCRNMITNYDDQDGRDAVWVQASQSVAKMGHTGLVFKYGSKWYYWYWGIHPKAAIWGYLASLAWSLLRRRSLIGTIYRVASTTVLATCMIREVSNKKTLTEAEARGLANRFYDSPTKFDNSLYIKGNFDNSYYYFRALNITRNYNLLRRNRMQTTVDGLYAGKFSSNNFLNHLRLTVARAMIVPKFAYSYMDRFF